MSDNPCDDCQEPHCYYYETCPDCLGSGISKRFAINGINAPNFYGLQHPVSIDRLCPTCQGRGRIITDCCPNYEGDFDE